MDGACRPASASRATRQLDVSREVDYTWWHAQPTRSAVTPYAAGVRHTHLHIRQKMPHCSRFGHQRGEGAEHNVLLYKKWTWDATLTAVTKAIPLKFSRSKTKINASIKIKPKQGEANGSHTQLTLLPLSSEQVLWESRSNKTKKRFEKVNSKRRSASSGKGSTP